MKFLLIVFLSFFAAAVYAKKIELIIPVKTSGTQYILSQELVPLLEEKGYTVDLKISGNCIKAGSDFNETKKPAAMLIFNAYSSLPECENSIPDDKTWVSNLTKSQIMICGKVGQDNLGIIKRKEKATIGSVNVYPSKIVLSLNPNLKYVPYTSSGSLAQGFISGDTDLLITNSLRASKLVKNNQAECFIATGNKDHLGATAATKLFPDWQYNSIFQLFSMMHKNMDDQDSAKFKKDIKEILTSDKWQEFTKKNGYDIDINITSEFYNRSSKLWSRE
jgi:hypothetical protein